MHLRLISRRVEDSDYTTQCLSVSKPKTEAGVRIIPMIDSVKDAFEMVREEQEETGFNETNLKVIQSIMGHFLLKMVNCCKGWKSDSHCSSGNIR